MGLQFNELFIRNTTYGFLFLLCDFKLIAFCFLEKQFNILVKWYFFNDYDHVEWM